MATTKKKVEKTSTKKPAVITAAPKKKTNKKSTGMWPKITKGSHLTVITHEDGRTELEWDDDALARDVREAIASVEMANLKPAVKAKAATRKKKVAS